MSPECYSKGVVDEVAIAKSGVECVAFKKIDFLGRVEVVFNLSRASVEGFNIEAF